MLLAADPKVMLVSPLGQRRTTEVVNSPVVVLYRGGRPERSDSPMFCPSTATSNTW